MMFGVCVVWCVCVLNAVAAQVHPVPWALPQVPAVEGNVLGNSSLNPGLHPESSSPPPFHAPLFLSDLIASKEIGRARTLSRVSGGPFPDEVVNYSGFLRVNKRFNSNLFFWFVQAETDYESAPIILWLQGGPGDTSLIGLFEEMGPFSVAEDGESLVLNPYSWHKGHSILYIDNPVGAGFSFTEHDKGYATSMSDVSSSLYSALRQFFKLFPELQKNDFFIAGESFAGKYIPSLGHTIHKKNERASGFKINLQGMAVGNGFTDPVSMLGLSELAFSLSLVDQNTRNTMAAFEAEAIRSIVEEDFSTAFMMAGRSNELFWKTTQFNYTYNFLHATAPPQNNRFVSFVHRPVVREHLHVGDVTFSHLDSVVSTGPVLYNLGSDYMVSAKPWLEELLEHYRVLYYSGQLDLIVAYPMSLKMYQSLRWSAAEEYKQAKRQPWFVDGYLAGYMKSAGNFTEVLVRNAGHMVPYDQPVWALDLITRFTSDKLQRSV